MWIIPYLPQVLVSLMYTEAEGSRFLWTFGKYQPAYTVSLLAK
jgi:hypothetical protein